MERENSFWLVCVRVSSKSTQFDTLGVRAHHAPDHSELAGRGAAGGEHGGVLRHPGADPGLLVVRHLLDRHARASGSAPH